MANEFFINPNVPTEPFDMNDPQQVKELLCKCVDSMTQDGYRLREISNNPILLMPEFYCPRNMEEWNPRIEGFEIHLKFGK